MYRWKTTKNILIDTDEYFDNNWSNYNHISQYAPPNPKWNSDRPISFEDVDLWEVISEASGGIGVYAAWCPYDEYYIVTNAKSIVTEFSGIDANKRLEQYLIKNKIPYPKSKTI